MGKTKRCLLDLLLAALCGAGPASAGAFRWVENGEQVLLLLQLPVLLWGCSSLCPAFSTWSPGRASSISLLAGSWPSTALWPAC